MTHHIRVMERVRSLSRSLAVSLASHLMLSEVYALGESQFLHLENGLAAHKVSRILVSSVLVSAHRPGRVGRGQYCFLNCALSCLFRFWQGRGGESWEAGSEGGSHQPCRGFTHLSPAPAWVGAEKEVRESQAVCLPLFLQPEYKYIDPICTFLFSILVLGTTLTILRDVILVLMEGNGPQGLPLVLGPRALGLKRSVRVDANACVERSLPIGGEPRSGTWQRLEDLGPTLDDFGL